VRESNRILAHIQIVQSAVAVADDNDMVVQHDPERCGRFLGVLGDRDRALLEDYAGEEPMIFLNGVESRPKDQRAT
jgi:hypothetical protein